MRPFNEIVMQLKARGDDLSLDAADKLERQADLLESKQTHEAQSYNRIFVIARNLLTAYDSGDSDKLQERIVQLEKEVNDG